MSADELLSDEKRDLAEKLWVKYVDLCYSTARELSDLGVHKQIAARVLEPVQNIKVICTGTEFENFFKLRIADDAQPEIQELAQEMQRVMHSSAPKHMSRESYHLPYVSSNENLTLDTAIKCSVARCARVSYLNHDKSIPDIEKDIALHDRLLESKHLSPFEHVASPLTNEIYATHIDKYEELWSGNFKNWEQYRHQIT